VSLELHALLAAQQSLTTADEPPTGAALRTRGGRIYTGCAIRLDAGTGGCALRHALAAARAEEGPGLEVEAIALVGLGGDGDPVSARPCADCRRWLAVLAPGAMLGYRERDGAWASLQVAPHHPGAKA